MFALKEEVTLKQKAQKREPSAALKHHSERDPLESNGLPFFWGILMPKTVCTLFVSLSDCPSLGNCGK